jgi:hypothetical protein
MDKVMSPPPKEWQRIELYFDPEQRDILRLLTNSKELFLTLTSVRKLLTLSQEEVEDHIGELEGAGWLTYARRVADSFGSVTDVNLYIGLSERIARRQLVARRFNSPKYLK